MVLSQQEGTRPAAGISAHPLLARSAATRDPGHLCLSQVLLCVAAIASRKLQERREGEGGERLPALLYAALALINSEVDYSQRDLLI